VVVVALVLLAQALLIFNQMAELELQIVLLAQVFIMVVAGAGLTIELTVQVMVVQLLVTVVKVVAELVAVAKEMVKQAVLPELAAMEQQILEAVGVVVHIFHQFRPGEQAARVDRV
jgi:predicted Rossmann-fold nucleotide-binding protein